MGKVKGQSSHADISNKQAVLTLITSKQNNDAKLKEIVDILQSYETISIHSHTEEYWKDPLSMTNDIVIKSKEPLLQSEWFDIFHRFSNHNYTFKNSGYLEIDWMVPVLDENEVFITLNIPKEMVKDY